MPLPSCSEATNVKSSRPSQYAIGVDYGTNSVRALLVDLADGAEIATAVFDYPSGEHGILLDPADPNLARQNPADYIEGFHQTVAQVVKKARKTPGFSPDRVVGIGVDTTGSTPLPVDADGIPLAMNPRFVKNPAAHAWLWKDHTAHKEAAQITEAAAKAKPRYTDKCGSTYSSEWWWSKILHCQRTAPAVFNAAAGWVELADFVPGYITGNMNPRTMPRGICAAGHKALWHDSWGGMPPKKFLDKLGPGLSRVVDGYGDRTMTSDQKAGGLIDGVAKMVGLPPGVAVAVGAFDAHMGAIGAGVKPGTLVKIMGTSTCDITVWPLSKNLPDIPGLCGIVPGSVLPGMYGLEAGQSAVGDIFNWFVRQLVPASFTRDGDGHAALTQAADALKPGSSGLLALDWNNGNRTVLVDARLTGLLLGQTLHTTAPEIYRALVEATAFGALTIIDRFEKYGVKIDEVINCGGIAEKNPMIVQIYADVCNRPMKVSRSAQTCALGAAICGAVAGGAFADIPSAQKKMTGTKKTVYRPRAAAAKVYAQLYQLYSTLHDAFGTAGFNGKLDHVMKQLIDIRQQARKGSSHA
jgi:L-ribulokinase